ncbi:MAG: FAD-binding oxidoreductase [Candidatus Tectomicrobia bacterium]
MQTIAQIARIRQETPTVKSFLFTLPEMALSFLPGQWVDLYIDDPALGPDVIVGGFSITSSPLQQDGIELAVKKIPEGQASVYMHERVKVGDRLLIDGGYGDFCYQEEMGEALVLIAGGIGITPLMSIIRFVVEAGLDVPITVFYSAKTPSELVFRQELTTIAAQHDKIRCQFTVTRPDQEPWDERVGRIDRLMLAEQGVEQRARYYVCGPRGFAQDMQAMLTALGVATSRVKSEAW